MFDAMATLTATTKAGEMKFEQMTAQTGTDRLLISKFTRQMASPYKD